MIDWVTAVVPVSNLDLSNLHNGWFFRIRPDGETEWTKEIGKDIPGSFDSNIRVSAHYLDSGPHIRIDGNPIKWLQGHNLFGSNDLIGLMKEVLHRLAYILERIQGGGRLNFTAKEKKFLLEVIHSIRACLNTITSLNLPRINSDVN